jgi:hypothetical protein
MELIGCGCLLGLVALGLSLPIAIIIIRKRRQAKAAAWDIVRRGAGNPRQIDACIAILSAAGDDAEAVELVKRLMEIKGRT